MELKSSARFADVEIKSSAHFAELAAMVAEAKKPTMRIILSVDLETDEDAHNDRLQKAARTLAGA